MKYEAARCKICRNTFLVVPFIFNRTIGFCTTLCWHTYLGTSPTKVPAKIDLPNLMDNLRSIPNGIELLVESTSKSKTSGENETTVSLIISDTTPQFPNLIRLLTGKARQIIFGSPELKSNDYFSLLVSGLSKLDNPIVATQMKLVEEYLENDPKDIALALTPIEFIATEIEASQDSTPAAEPGHNNLHEKRLYAIEERKTFGAKRLLDEYKLSLRPEEAGNPAELFRTGDMTFDAKLYRLDQCTPASGYPFDADCEIAMHTALRDIASQKPAPEDQGKAPSVVSTDPGFQQGFDF